MTQGSASAPRIRMLREIASGPLSATFVAERQRGADVDLVSVKVLRQRTKGDVDRLLRLCDASRELAQLTHPNILCVEDVARVGDLVALVSPYVDGIDVLDWVEILREQGVVMPTRARCEIVLGVAEALDAALNEIPPDRNAPLERVHRDIRPSNIMIDRAGGLRVLDFGTGFSTLAGRAARAGALKKGIIKYMSPGRREGKRGGPSADVYALGIMAVELFRGRWLRRLRSHNPSHDRYLSEVVARLVNLGLGTDQDELALKNILLRMIAFDPEARPPAREVAITFQGLAERARRASLSRFAKQHAVPWLEEPERVLEPDPDLAGVQVHVLGTGATWDDVPFYEDGDVPDKLRMRADRDGMLWEETLDGWRETGDHADTLEAFFDEEDTREDEAPLPGAPMLDDEEDVEDEPTEPGGILPEELAPATEDTQTDPTLAGQRVVGPPRAIPVEVEVVDTGATTVPEVTPDLSDVDTLPTDPLKVLPKKVEEKPAGRSPVAWILIAALLLLGLAITAGLAVGLAIAFLS